MGALQIRKQLHEFVEIGDSQFLDVLYKTAKEYMENKRLDSMIEEGEADIKSGKTYSLANAKKIIDNWDFEENQ